MIGILAARAPADPRVACVAFGVMAVLMTVFPGLFVGMARTHSLRDGLPAFVFNRWYYRTIGIIVLIVVGVVWHRMGLHF